MTPAEQLLRELREEYPAVDVTTVVFSADFAGVGCCVIPQDRMLAVISALEGQDALVKALEECRSRLKMDLDEIQHLRGWLSASELAERDDQDQVADEADKQAIAEADKALAKVPT